MFNQVPNTAKFLISVVPQLNVNMKWFQDTSGAVYCLNNSFPVSRKVFPQKKITSVIYFFVGLNYDKFSGLVLPLSSSYDVLSTY